MNTILTSEGVYFDFRNPEAHKYNIREIAHALSNICRFTGHVREFYSVAEHSVRVSYMVPPELALQGLMHDATEAYVGDMASPLKRMFPEYKLLEQRVWNAMSKQFGLPMVLDPAVHAADLKSLMHEKAALMPRCNSPEQWPGPEVDSWKLRPLRPVMARLRFLKRYEELTR